MRNNDIFKNFYLTHHLRIPAGIGRGDFAMEFFRATQRSSSDPLRLLIPGGIPSHKSNGGSQGSLGSTTKAK
jgi:hypothetical protein